MSTSTKYGANVTFIHNGDFSGEVAIIRDSINGSEEISVPFNSLKFIVAEYIRNKKIEELEQATNKEILGL